MQNTPFGVFFFSVSSLNFGSNLISMKKVLLWTVLYMVAQVADATIRIVDSQFASPTSFTTVQAAIDASSPNDTIYVQASLASYPAATLTIPLVIFGEGALPNQQHQKTSSIASLTLTYSSGNTTNAGGSKIYGLYMENLFLGSDAGNGTCTACVPPGVSAPNYNLSNVSLERNYIKNVKFSFGAGAYFNLIFKNNIISELLTYSSTMYNSSFENNIIMNGFYGGSGPHGSGNNFSHNTCFINNISFSGANIVDNLFDISGQYSSSQTFTTGYSYAYFHRNVFGMPLSTQSNAQITSTFGENQFVTGTQIIQGKPEGTGVINANYWSPGPYWNLHFNSSTAGVGYASDGTDVGIYGGNSPWVDEVSTDERFRYFAAPSQLPVLTELNILTPNTTPNGTLNFQFKAKSQN
jgi:hypothetical protein